MIANAPPPTLDRAPALTLPEAEAAWIREAYSAGRSILEYGSGGSTALAASMPGKSIWSVESDWSWMMGLDAWFKANPQPSKVNLRHGDVGPTGKWGRPKGTAHHSKFHRYALDIWDEKGFTPPDTVLIDGRFRAACFLAVAYRTAKPVSVYFDDYIGRPAYHVVERFGPPSKIVGRMARFDVEPQKITGDDLKWILDIFARVQ